MTRKETVGLLKILADAYPNQKINNPKGTLDIWSAAFAEDEAEVVYKSASIVIKKSPYMPNIADIKNLMTKARYLLEMEKREQVIEAPKVLIDPNVSFCDLCGLCDKDDQSLCDW